ncbi:non-canonical purine NTP pyrophosphatase [Phreatobacter cathodiphilus]|uniref:dITP/XTP pyrophosphatase n=1 Tax=Phreatobacter cathodiphilus TaxID=1868589 RepID=A0A2S0NF80_9HYPH|nr:non-canonical purine NTP pyrophosphatase [Phreatobacter cathodiphilus]AVO46686.1 non-canonical purine NTP pyrophosphatase [Phreatobacter cathodiphilus]
MSARLGPGTRLVVATHNAGKLAEFRDLLGPHGIDLVSAGELGLPEPAETGTLYAENAAIKARAATDATGLPAIADDSGLAVEALDGAPGLFTADWAGQPRDFAAAMARVDRELTLRGVTTAGARAHFVSALALTFPDGSQQIFEGRVFGTLAWPPRGTKGFGYDPMFLPDDHALTFGEMSAEEKHGLPPKGEGLSHRARAFMALQKAVFGS